MSHIKYEDFEKIDIRAGKIIRVEDFPAANIPAYKLWIDFGDLGIRRSSARITRLYTGDDLIGRQVIAVDNFHPKQIADFISEVLVLGTILNNDEVILIKPDQDVPAGSRIL